MKLEKEFLIKSVEGDFYYSTVEVQGQINLTDDEKWEYFKVGGCKNIKAKLTLETQEPILDEAERKYLSSVIRPFKKGKAVIRIKKHKSIFENSEEIGIDTFYIGCGHTTNLPPFKKDTMYKGMKLNKEYTLEELGL